MALASLDAVRTRYPYFEGMQLKDEQRVVLERLLTGKNCVVQLPTGFGKSLLFALPPVLMDEGDNGVKHTAVVVCPLRSLMADQLRQMKKMGISAAAVTQDLSKTDRQALLTSPPSVILASPEAIVAKPYRSLLKKASLFVLDEAHCASEWGLDFRRDYRRVGEIVSVIQCPTLCLSATITSAIDEDLRQLLALDEETYMLAKKPDRPNVQLLGDSATGAYENLDWLVSLLREKNTACPKVLIFTPNVNSTSRLYRWLMTELDINAFKDKVRHFGNRMLDMYHSHSDEDSRVRVQEAFTKSDSHIRVVVATVALGLGVDIPDLRIVVHWGLEKSVLVYWQEVGRAGRDGKPAIAITYTKAGSGVKCSELVTAFGTPGCIRRAILAHFLPVGDDYVAPSASGVCICACCSHCAKQCECDSTVTIESAVAQL